MIETTAMDIINAADQCSFLCDLNKNDYFSTCLWKLIVADIGPQ